MIPVLFFKILSLSIGILKSNVLSLVCFCFHLTTHFNIIVIQQAQKERIEEQQIEKAEQQRLEEILNMCAEYEKQVQCEKNSKPIPNR